MVNLASNILKNKEIRQIDIDYHTELSAKNTQEIVDINSKLLHLQLARSYANLEQQEKTNNSLNEIKETINNVSEGIESLNKNIDNLTDEIASIKMKLEKGFQLILEEIRKQQKQLEEIKNILSKPYETSQLELRKNANYWLFYGMRDSGEDQSKYFSDAMKLLNQCLKNPVGEQDYVVWFQKGWLLWKYMNNIKEAEKSFSEARRLSKPKRDLYYLKSVRHLAYMQYLNGDLNTAYKTIKQIVDISEINNDHDTLFDAARYAVRNGYKEEALKYLDQCINLRPETSVTMFAEEDFLCL